MRVLVWLFCCSFWEKFAVGNADEEASMLQLVSARLEDVDGAAPNQPCQTAVATSEIKSVDTEPLATEPLAATGSDAVATPETKSVDTEPPAARSRSVAAARRSVAAATPETEPSVDTEPLATEPLATPDACRASTDTPDDCTVTNVPLAGCTYSAGDLIHVHNGKQVSRATEENSCPMGWKIFSPASQDDWQCLLASLGDYHQTKIGTPPIEKNEWPADPWLIVDVTKSHNGGYQNCTKPCQVRPALRSDNEDADEWHTSDGSEFWLNEDSGYSPNGNYVANCFLTVVSVNTIVSGTGVGVNDAGFDDAYCDRHSKSYLCQKLQ